LLPLLDVSTLHPPHRIQVQQALGVQGPEQLVAVAVEVLVREVVVQERVLEVVGVSVQRV
jgi:hypothetical protein